MASQPAPTTRLCRPRRLWRSALRATAAALAVLVLGGGYLWLSTPLPTPARLRELASSANTRILDRRGRLLFAAPDPLSGWRQPVALTAIPPALRQATIAVEDAGFYQNPGVDLRGIARAAWANLRSGQIVAGGSTITQQLVRGCLLDPDLAGRQSIERKLREAVLALKLTAAYSKDEILALYLNQVYYGGLSYGVDAAAHHYFGKPARDLDLAEAALLAGLPQAPSRYDPLAHPEAARQRQAQVLDAMVRAGAISVAQAADAKAEPLRFASADSQARAPHFVNYVLDTLSARLGSEIVSRGGLVVTTTLDLDLQAAAQAALRRQVALLATPRAGQPDHQVRNGAVVVLDPHDGAILAMVGSPDFADQASQGQVNAALALRQPGSAIKPLTYAAALERGWTPATEILDVPTTFRTREGQAYAPQNYDRSFHGPLSLREALATSSNVAAVRTLDHIGVPALLEMAHRLGVYSLGRNSGRFGLALTLGGGEVTPLELTSAYAAFANGGRSVLPYAILTVSDAWGQTADSRRQTADSKPQMQAVSPQVAYLISDILADRYARMRAFGSRSVLDIDRPAAVKTGTSSDWRDNWTVGYTPDRVVGVWVGNANGQPMRGVSGITGAGPVWHEVMLAAHRGLPPRAFARPAGIVEATICAEGGLLPSLACPATRPERFIAGSMPARADDSHVALRVDRLLGCRAPAGYPPARVATRIFRLLPPEAAPWAAAAGLARPPRASCPPLAEEGGVAAVYGEAVGTGAQESQLLPAPDAAGSDTPQLLSPVAGAVFRVSPGIPRERQQIALRGMPGRNAAALTIVIDGVTVAMIDAPPYHAFWQLAPGTHRAWAEASDAQGRLWRSPETRFTVVEN